MSIQSEINRIQSNVANAYVAVSGKGGNVPDIQNSDGLAEAISSIPTGGGEVYSTEETRIGTWIDGKPLYRKVIQCQAPSDTNVWAIISPVIPFARVHSISAGIVGDGTYFDPVPLLSLNGIVLKLHYDSEDSSILPPGLNGYCVNGQYINANVIAVLEYTKTTDQPVTASTVSDTAKE